MFDFIKKKFTLNIKILVDCEWGLWSEWRGRCGHCTKHHHKKRKKSQRRDRYIEVYPEHGGKPCITEKQEEITGDEEDYEQQKQECDPPPCPKVADEPYWSTWKEWEPCEGSEDTRCYKSSTSGTRRRKRSCQVGRDRKDAKILQVKDCQDRHIGGEFEQTESCRSPCTSFSRLHFSLIHQHV